jgi:hypothetical protein
MSSTRAKSRACGYALIKAAREGRCGTAAKLAASSTTAGSDSNNGFAARSIESPREGCLVDVVLRGADQIKRRKFACAVERFESWSCQIEAKVVSLETDDIANGDPFEQVLTLEEWYSLSLTVVDR